MWKVVFVSSLFRMRTATVEDCKRIAGFSIELGSIQEHGLGPERARELRICIAFNVGYKEQDDLR